MRGMEYRYEDIAGMIDHSLLAPTLTAGELEGGCGLAVECGVASVCIMPYYLKRCAELLSGSTVKPSTTIGFPHGGHATAVKVAEAAQAVADGGRELDMVVNISKVLSGDWGYVRRDIEAVVEAAHASGAKVKVIFEACYLDDSQKVMLCEICTDVGADWVKTSTGFGSGGATAADVELMVRTVGPGVQVKASGGVRDLDAVVRFRGLGATRIGTSRTREILEECRRRAAQ